MSEENSPDQAKSLPPDAPLSAFQIALALERIKNEMRANRELATREFELIRADIKVAKDNDERFKVMETHFKTAKWLAGIAIVAAVGSLVTNVTAAYSRRIIEPPAPASNAERLGSDRVQHDPEKGP